MSYISRLLPLTIEAIQEALNRAMNKRNTIPPAQVPLSPATNLRLTTISSQFNSAVTEVATAKLAYTGNTPFKESARLSCRIFTSHFIQVFNLGVARGKYTRAQRSAFELPVESDSVPNLDSDTDLLNWANRIIIGDPIRLTAGGLPMANPETTEVDTAYGQFLSTFNTQSTLKDELDLKQEAVEALIPEAEKVVKKIWDELETFYNEEDDSSRRENCREWGVVYVTVGSSKILSGTVTYNGQPGTGLTVRVKNGRNKSTTTALGSYSLTTTLMGNQQVVIEKTDENNVVIKQWEFIVTLSEDENHTANFTIAD